jgi:DNA sulfur modification protein DndD
MLLSELKLIDFRQFYGENTLFFSTDTKRNITLIHGENGIGKTTLLNSILWCLFDKLTPDFERPKELVNHEAAKEGKSSCRVEVTFIHEGIEYLAQRQYNGVSATAFKVYQIEDGNYQEMPGPKGFINSVLPQDMAPYFFFHGEGVASISDSKSSANFREAVRNILGFTFAEAAISDLKRVNSEYTRQLGSLETKDKGMKKAADEKATAEQQVEELKKNLEAVFSETKSKSLELEEVDEKIGSSGNINAERVKREIAASEKRLLSHKAALSSLNVERQTLIQNYGWAVFGAELMNQGLEFIDESTFKGRIPAPYQDSFVNDLLEDELCICGTQLSQGSAARENVKKLLETASTASITQKIMKARSVAANLEGRAEEFLHKVRELELKKSQLDRVIGEEERTCDDLESELSGIDEAAIKRLVEKRRKLKSEEESLHRRQGALKNEIKRLEQLIDRYARELATSGSNSAQYKRIAGIQRLISEMISRCEARLEGFEKSARSQIAELVNEFLKGFSRKDYVVKVTEDFDFHLARTDGKVVAKSKGEKLLLNLAFVSALIEQAEIRTNASGEFLIRGTVAPFVIDAPFGELDDTYRRATAEFLPEKVRQIVFLLSSSHWEGTVDQTIRDRVGEEYLLISNRKSERGNKPVDEITIRGNTYQQSKYGANRDQTTIEQVN